MSFIKNIAFIFVIAFFFAGVTSGVNMALSARIKLNEETRVNKQLLEALGIPFSDKSSPETIQEIKSKRVKSAVLGNERLFAAITDQGSVDRFAFPVTGKGLWGSIQGLLALNKDLTRVEGLIFTSHVETPGLGARIDEQWFRDQFHGIDLQRKASEDKFLKMGPGSSESVNRVDSITGATITSMSVEKMLNEAIRSILSEKDQIRGLDWQSLPKK